MNFNSNPLLKEKDKTCFICYENWKKKKGKLMVLFDNDEDGFWIEQYFCEEHAKAVQSGKIKLGNIWLTEKKRLKDFFKDQTDVICSDGKEITKYVKVLVPFDTLSAK
jgi:hypothetical protein